MLDEQGLEGLTLRAIARRAHVSHGAPGKHFPSLAALLAAVGAGGFRDLIAAVDDQLARLPEGADAYARLAAAGRGYVAFATANPGVFNLMFRPERLDTTEATYVAASAESFLQLETIVGDAQTEGFHPDVDRRRLASIVWTTVHGLADLWLRGGGLPGADATFGLDDFVALSQSIVLGRPAGRTDQPDPGPRRRNP
jgi:AcrR family transcriptional regulator